MQVITSCTKGKKELNDDCILNALLRHNAICYGSIIWFRNNYGSHVLGGIINKRLALQFGIIYTVINFYV